MNAQDTGTVTACHDLNVSHRPWDDLQFSDAKQLKPAIIKGLPGEKLSLGIHL